MSDDDNALKDIDLDAWDVPSPEMSADELADGVIARLEGTDVGAAIPVEPSPSSTKKRALLIAGVAAAVIAAVIGGWTVVRGTKRAASREGAVIAKKAQSIDLDGAHADLDVGADVRWKRDGSILHVEQRTGNAAWRVGTDSKLVIDAGAPMGGASVEATGASLRVEVKPMNAADVRIAGALTTTAALVAVVVYEGHVKVHDRVTQQTVIVQPGATYTVEPPLPDEDEPVVGVAPLDADQPPEVTVFAGHDVVIHDMAPPTRVKIDMRDLCETAQPELVVNGVKTTTDQFAFNRGTVTYDVTCDDVAAVSGSITVVRDALSRPMTTPATVNEVDADGRTYRIAYQVMPALEVHGGPGTLHVAHGSVEKTYEARGESVLVPAADLTTALEQSMIHGANGTTDDLKVWFTPDKMSTVSLSLDRAAPIVSLAPITWGPQIVVEGTTLASSVVDVAGVTVPVDASGRFKANVPGGGDTLVVMIQTVNAGQHYAVARAKTTPVATNAVTVGPAPCDAVAEKQKGMENVNVGQYAAALAHFEASLKCKDDSMVRALAYMSACNSRNEPKARLYYGKMNAAEQQKYLPLCVRNKIDPSTATGCDADAMKHKGFDLVTKGQHANALKWFEASLLCKDDAFVAELAVTAACNAKNADKAKQYLPKLGPTQQVDMAEICKRNGITLITSTSWSDAKPGKCGQVEADAFKDAGMENVNNGEHANALEQFEASLRCKNDTYVLALAFMAACNAQNPTKAKLYYAKLSPAQQTKYKVMCIKNHIDPQDTCDATALKDKGLENVNMGQHAAALVQFELSLRCKSDQDVLAFAYMSACDAQNVDKARLYYAKLTTAQQIKYKAICVRNKIDPTLPTTATGTPPAPASCDADALKAKGLQNVNMGQHAAALGQFEASLRCKSNTEVIELAFMASCNAQNAEKARLYYGKLSAAEQARVKVMCVRNNIDPTGAAPSPNAAAPSTCDADKLKDMGMQSVNNGDHVQALGYFDASLRCKNDPYVLSLAFMAACNAQNGARAKAYYTKLTPKQQTTYRVMCDRNNIDVETGGPFDTSATGTGYLEVTCTPQAKVLIDGKDTGLTTPVKGKKLPLSVGKHRLTLVVGDDRFTYPFAIAAGQTVEMSKDLR